MPEHVPKHVRAEGSARLRAKWASERPRTYLGFTNWWAPILFAVGVAGTIVGVVGLVLSLT